MRWTVAILLVAIGCSSQADPEDDPGPDAAVVDGVDAAPTPPPDAAPPDAGPPMETQWTSIDTELTSCSQACAALGVGCTGTCEDGAGAASYGYFDWDFGITRIVETLWFPSCGDPVPATVTQDGETYERASASCCCEIPVMTRVPGDASAPAACNDVCATAGFAGCGDFYDWQNGSANGSALGGVIMTYRRPETGSVGWWIAGCAHVPAPTRTSGSVVRNLSDFTCACY